MGTSPGTVIDDRPGLRSFLRLLNGVRDVEQLRRLARSDVPELEADAVIATNKIVHVGESPLNPPVSHLVSLGLNWFGQGEWDRASVRRAMMMPYPRMGVLHLSVLAAFFLLLALPNVAADAVIPVALLCGLNTGLDAWFHLRERFAVQASVPGYT